MDNLSDIESIISAQTWKRKSFSHQGSPMGRSPCGSSSNSRKGSPMRSVRDSSQGSEEMETQVEIEGNSELQDGDKGRVSELVKLAVPYKALNDALRKVGNKLKPPAMIPAFPKRKFGSVRNLEPNQKFELLTYETYTSSLRKNEVNKIKKLNGRTNSTSSSKLPPLYSQRLLNL